MKKVEILGFTDSDKNKYDTVWEEYAVICPEVLLAQTYDYILILSSYFGEIRDKLLEQYGVCPEKILSINGAYQMYVRNVHGNGRKFNSRSLISEISFSEQMSDKVVTDMDNMFYYLYIQDKYKDFIEKFRNNLSSYTIKNSIPDTKANTPIWVCWLQGIENAPDIVKCCVNSIIKNVEGKIHIITYDNYSEYVEISKIILEKHKLGIIDRTKFSNIIRLAILCKYGGIWMDATLLMMDRGLPDYVYENPLFMYKIRETLDKGYPDPRFFTNWFIKSEKENPIINAVYRMHEEWWKTENEVPYCLFHYVMRIIWEMYEDVCPENANTHRLNIYDNNCRVLVEMLNKEYDETFWNMLRAEQPLQKLSWKFDYLKEEGTFMDIL